MRVCWSEPLAMELCMTFDVLVLRHCSGLVVNIKVWIAEF